jgi:tetratricopeptide (TPR) repeat protein
MVYDFSNRPIPYCEISLGRVYKGSTDINGRFILPQVPFGEYDITVSKKGYESYIDKIRITDRNQIIYIRIPSQNQLLGLVDEALTNNNLSAAEEILERAYLIDQNNIEMLFYYANVSFRQQNYSKAISFLETAKRLGSRDIYIENFLNVLEELQNGK